MNGRPLKFKLSGINNQNFLMTDNRTGSWWQQITGEAILGRLKGSKLDFVYHDQITFMQWKKEFPHGRVLKPDEDRNMVEKDWESQIADFPTVTSLDPESPLDHRTVVIGICLGDRDVAYPRQAVKEQSPVQDTLGELPVLLAYAEDGRSLRVFDRRVEGHTLELFAKPDSETLRLVDTQTGSEWDFTGTAVGGPLRGTTLRRIPVSIEYWFDWLEYHPNSQLNRLGWTPGEGSRDPEKSE